jgi:hypothetical protein
MSHSPRLLALAGAAALLASFAAQAATTQDASSYRVTDTLVGSVLPQAIITGPLPFDATYAQLTPDQRAVLASEYESLGPGDEPPYPIYGIHHLVKPLVTFVENRDPVGPLIAAVQVDSWGNASSVTVYQSPDSQLTQLVSGALNLEKYKPAKCHGQPCSMQYVLRLDFPARNAFPVTKVSLQPFDNGPGVMHH